MKIDCQYQLIGEFYDRWIPQQGPKTPLGKQ